MRQLVIYDDALIAGPDLTAARGEWRIVQTEAGAFELIGFDHENVIAVHLMSTQASNWHAAVVVVNVDAPITVEQFTCSWYDDDRPENQELEQKLNEVLGRHIPR